MAKAIGVAFTSYTVSDVTRARAFYKDVLGLTETATYFDEEKGLSFIEYDAGAHTIVLCSEMMGYKPSKDGACVALEVDDFEGYIDNLKKHNVKFTMDALDSGACYMAMLEDSEGNSIMIHKKKQ